MLVVCDYCYKEFDKKPAYIKVSKHNFCSKNCSNKAKIKIDRKRICLTCLKAFIAKQADTKFCSMSCSAKYNNNLRPKKPKEVKEKRNKKYNKETASEYGKRHSLDIRKAFVKMYGGLCACCGEIEIEFLTLDHIIPRTSENRQETGSKGYSKALSEYRPDLYQVLCFNCNCARRHGVCPHKKYLGVAQSGLER